MPSYVGEKQEILVRLRKMEGQLKGIQRMVAGIRFPFRNWKDITEQPYKVTARIPMPKRKPIRITKRPPRITPKLVRLRR